MKVLLWIGAAGGALAALTAFGVVGRKLLRALAQLDAVGPAIMDMARQFNADGSSTLRGVLDGVTRANEHAATLAQTAVAVAKTSEEAAAAARIIAESASRMTLTHESRLVELDKYIHDMRHEFAQSLTVIQGAAALRLKDEEERIHPPEHNRRASDTSRDAAL